MSDCKRKILEIKLESVDPRGWVTESVSSSMKVIDDENCMKRERFFLHVGECLYSIDNKGFIIERLVPHEKNH